jgi:hypothetical protein
MRVLTRQDFPRAMSILRERLASGHVGILPTGSAYVLCASGLNLPAVRALLRLQPLEGPAVLVPHSVPWAMLVVAPEQEPQVSDALQRYRGHTTLWRYSARYSTLPAPLTRKGLLGLTWPAHWISQLAQDIALPLLVSPVLGERGAPMRSLDELPPRLRSALDFLAYEGTLPGQLGALVHCHETPHRVEARP